MSAKNTPESFWRRVKKDAPNVCWYWMGARTSSGYGSLSWHGVHTVAHRVAYFLRYGGITLETGFREEGKAKRYKRFVLHTCDNRACCNPGHLFLGSMRSNILDAYSKGRKKQPQSKHVNAKLTAKQVREIRKLYDRGVMQQIPLAKKYGVSQRAISLIVRRETYKDVT